MKKRIRNKLKYIVNKLLEHIYGKESNVFEIINHKHSILFDEISNYFENSKIGKNAKLYSVYSISHSEIDDYTYIAQNSKIKYTKIGKFCSIGPNFLCGWGLHPTNGVSTAPMFYSTMKQNGMTLSNSDKFEELKPIVIGNDVFIGMNVTILDGVIIGDGAVIGAGAVVSKDIPPYAIAVGSPIRIIKYRFDKDIINSLINIKWWNLPDDKLILIEKHFWDVKTLIEKVKELRNSV